MTPAFRIYANDANITAAVQDRLIDLSIIDEAGIKSDELRLTLDDRHRENGAIAELPRVGTSLTVSLGYAETTLVKMGSYIVDEIEISAPPATLTVSARAANMVGPFRSPKTRSWDTTTLGKIVTTIAQENGYKPKVDPELAALAIPHIDQTAESDMAFLTRLALSRDAIVKPMDGYLVLAKQGDTQTVTGNAKAAITLRVSDLIEWRYRHSSRAPSGSGKVTTHEAQKPPTTATGGTKAYWWDLDKGERREVTVGKPPFAEVRHVHITEAEALAAAKKGVSGSQRAQGEMSFSLPGDARLAAEGRLSISLRQGIPTDWRIKRVEHRLSAQGYTTQVECERFVTSNQPITSSTKETAP